MAQVTARPGESFDSLYKRFKKAVDNSGILTDARKHEFYEKPSVKRKRKDAAATKRFLKRKSRTDRFTPKSGQNFKFNKDRTQKIPIAANSNKPNNYNNSNNTKKNFSFKKKNFNRPNKLKPTESKGN